MLSHIWMYFQIYLSVKVHLWPIFIKQRFPYRQHKKLYSRNVQNRVDTCVLDILCILDSIFVYTHQVQSFQHQRAVF